MSEVKIDFIGNIKDLLPHLKTVIEEAEKVQVAAGKAGKGVDDEFKKAGGGVDILKSKIRESLGGFGEVGEKALEFGKKAKEGFSIGSKASFSFGTALKAIPLLAVLGVITSLIAYFTKTAEGAKKLEMITAGFTEIIKILVDKVASFGKVIVEVFTNPGEGIKKLGKMIQDNVTNRFLGLADILTGFFSFDFEKMANGFLAVGTGVKGLGTELKKAAIEAAHLAHLQAILNGHVRDLNVLNEERQGNADLLLLSAKDQSKLAKDRIADLKEAGKLELEISDSKIKAAERQLKITQEQNRGAGKADLDKEAEEKITLQRLKNDQKLKEQFIKNRESLLLKELAADQKVADEKAKAQREADKEEAKDRLKKLAEDAAKSAVSGSEGMKRINEIRAQARAEVTEQEKWLKERNLMTKEGQENIGKIRIEIERQTVAAIIALQEEELKAKIAAGIKELDLEEQIAIEKIKLLSNPELDPITLEQEKQKGIIMVQVQFAEERLQLLKEQTGKEAKLQRLLLQNQIKDLQEEYNKIGAGQKSIFEMLGLNKDQEIEARKNLKTFASALQSALKEMTQMRVEAADRAIDEIQRQADEEEKLRDKRIDQLQSNIDVEKELLNSELENKRNGYNNDVKGARERLQELQKTKQAEIAAQIKADQQEKIALRKAEAERKKALEIQRRIDSASQGISIITASANILKGWSSVPFVGQVLGIAAIGAMVAAFLASKARINAATKSEGFRKGGFSGHGNPWEEAGPVHKEEFIFTQEKTKKHRDLFEAIHNDRPLPDSALKRLLEGTGVKMRDDVPRRFGRLIAESRYQDTTANMKGIESSVKNIESNTSVLATKATEKKIEYFEGYRIEIFGNIKRRING